MSQLEGCVERAGIYQLAEDEARQIIDRQIEVVVDNWVEVTELGRLSEVERELFANRQFLNPYALQSYRLRDGPQAAGIRLGGN